MISHENSLTYTTIILLNSACLLLLNGRLLEQLLGLGEVV